MKIKKSLHTFITKTIEFKLLSFLLFLGLFAPHIANDLPIMCVFNGKIFFPTVNPENFNTELEKNTDTKMQSVSEFQNIEYDAVIWPLIPYCAGKPDEFLLMGSENKENNQKNDTRKHLLGTTYLGSDLCADLIHGFRRSTLICMLVCSISAILGILIGSFAGFMHDQEFKISIWDIVRLSLCLVWICFYPPLLIKNVENKVDVNDTISYFFISLSILFVSIYFLHALNKSAFTFILFSIKPVNVYLYFINLYFVFPPLLISIFLVSNSTTSFTALVMFLAIYLGIDISRFVYSKLNEFKDKGFFDSADAVGCSFVRKIRFHFLPNILPDVLVLLINNFTTALVAESTLSFLGIGTKPDEITLGKILYEARTDYGNYLLTLGPCILISFVIILLNSISDKIRKFHLLRS